MFAACGSCSAISTMLYAAAFTTTAGSKSQIVLSTAAASVISTSARSFPRTSKPRSANSRISSTPSCPALPNTIAFLSVFAMNPLGYRTAAVAKSDVLHFFLEVEAEAVVNAALQVVDDFAELPRSALPGVVDEIRVVIGDADIAVGHALRANLLQEVRRWHLALDDHALRHVCLDRPGQFVKEQVLEDRPGALHGGRVLPVADFTNLGRAPS